MTIKAFASCNRHNNVRDETCFAGDLPGAILISRTPDLEYTLCVRKPDTTGPSCESHRTGVAGKPSRIDVPAPQVGEYEIEWQAAGEVVATGRFTLAPEIEAGP